MTTKFKRQELPLAYTMIENASRLRPRRDGGHLYQQYFLLWAAFNNVYTTIAHHQGLRTRIMEDGHGAIVRVPNGSVLIPKVGVVPEIKQIALVVGQIDGDQKHDLILHPSTEFFITRVPAWGGAKIEYDSLGQRVNGVINVDFTSDGNNPIWSPIDLPTYQDYINNPGDEEKRDFLTRQVLEVLYTVQLNFMHASQKFDDSNDITVIENALPLLELVLQSFID